MSSSIDIPRSDPSFPRLIVVTGRPGSGKSTLSHPLARAIRCPLISRDEIKEGFVRTTGRIGGPGHPGDLAVYETFFATVMLLLKQRVTLVAEAAFQHKLWAPKAEELRAIAQVRVIVCDLDAELAAARHAARAAADPERQRFHYQPPPSPSGQPHLFEYDPPRINVPTLTVHTTENYSPSFEAIVRFALAQA
jgi:predicted kinase